MRSGPFGVRSILIEPGFVTSRIADNMPVPDRPVAVYNRGRDTILAAFTKAFESASLPEAVAELVLKAVSAQRPKVRYTAGPSVFEKSFRKQFGLEAA